MKRILIILAFSFISIFSFSQNFTGFWGLDYVGSDTVEVKKFILSEDLVTGTTKLSTTDTILVTLEYLKSFIDSVIASGDLVGSGNFVDSIYTVEDSLFPGIKNLTYNKGDSIYTVAQLIIQDGIDFGGNVSWFHDLTFNVSLTHYYINGYPYYVFSDSISLNPADPTNPRIDIIVVDTTGSIDVIEGTPGVNPLKPTVDPLSQIELTEVLVLAGATTPTGIDGSVIYDENTEWTGAGDGVTVNFDATISPFSGSKDADVETLTSGDKVTFTNATEVFRANYTTISFALKLKAGFTGSRMFIVFKKGGAYASSPIEFEFNKSNTTTWQTITIPLSDFGWGKASFDEVVFMYISGTSNTGIYLDHIILQNGVVQPDMPDLSGYWTKDEITNADTTLWNKDNDPLNEIDSIYDANSSQWLSNGDTIPEITESADTLFTTVPLCNDTLTLTTAITRTIPWAENVTITNITAFIPTAPTGSAAIFDIKEEGTTIFSTKIQVDSGDNWSTDSGTSYALSDAVLAKYSKITLTVDQIGSTTAGNGAFITLYYVRN